MVSVDSRAERELVGDGVKLVVAGRVLVATAAGRELVEVERELAGAGRELSEGL